MQDKKSNTPRPEKPYPDFPLFPHLSGQWAKKIRKKMHYFGRWNDWEVALQKYLKQRDDLYAGRKPRSMDEEGLIVQQLVNKFLNTKRILMERGELSPRTHANYQEAGVRMTKEFGENRLVSDLTSEDLQLLREKFPRTWGVIREGNMIQWIRSILKYAYDEGLIAAPVRCGQAFRRASKKTLRRMRRERPKRMFQAEEVCRMVRFAKPAMRAMIFLAINCGFGNNDCATLALKNLDLDRGWVEHPRPKTGVERRCVLWPETIEALREAIEHRGKPKEAELEDLVFITKRGLRWNKTTSTTNPVSQEFAKVLKAAELVRPRIGFYGLRHTFETIAGNGGDQVAVDYVMGHAPMAGDMASEYREWIFDRRIKKVTDRMHRWLFGLVVLRSFAPCEAVCDPGEFLPGAYGHS